MLITIIYLNVLRVCEGLTYININNFISLFKNFRNTNFLKKVPWSFLAESVEIAEITQLGCKGFITEALRSTLISQTDFLCP